MQIEDELFLDDDMDILNVVDFGFPRNYRERTNFFEDLDELTFFKRFRLTKDTTMNLLEQIEEELDYDNNLNNSITPMNQLLTTLRFYATGGHQSSIADFVGMNQSTASRIIRKVSNSIARLLPRFVKMPEANEIVGIQNTFYQLARFPRVIGSIDGTHIKLQSPGGEDAEVYRNRKTYFSINAQVVSGPNLEIYDIVARWPGSTHDLTIFNNSRLRARFEEGEFPNCVLLGDSGYTSRSYFLTPVPNPNTRPEQLYNESLIRTRNTSERQIGVWKRRFPCLAYGFRCQMETVLPAIVATAVLHNLAITMNEEVPPLENVNIEELEYLINQGNIDDVPNAQNYPNNNYRNNLIQNYFATL